jgi:hypothetical protein
VISAPKWLSSLLLFQEDILTRMKNHNDFSTADDAHVHKVVSETECDLHCISRKRRKNLVFAGPGRCAAASASKECPVCGGSGLRRWGNKSRVLGWQVKTAPEC